VRNFKYVFVKIRARFLNCIYDSFQSLFRSGSVVVLVMVYDGRELLQKCDNICELGFNFRKLNFDLLEFYARGIRLYVHERHGHAALKGCSALSSAPGQTPDTASTSQLVLQRRLPS